MRKSMARRVCGCVDWDAGLRIIYAARYLELPNLIAMLK
jgi:hypothetical protein